MVHFCNRWQPLSFQTSEFASTEEPITDFLVWNQPEVVILGADRKNRSLWEREWATKSSLMSRVTLAVAKTFKKHRKQLGLMTFMVWLCHKRLVLFLTENYQTMDKKGLLHTMCETLRPSAQIILFNIRSFKAASFKRFQIPALMLGCQVPHHCRCSRPKKSKESGF